MSIGEEYSDLDPNNPKKKRRPRSQTGDRNFVCGCGKCYLSYPALYTHVKNKHQGIFPIGSFAKKKTLKESNDKEVLALQPDIDRYFANFDEFLKQIKDAKAVERKEFTEEKIDFYFQFIMFQESQEMKLFRESLKEMLLMYNNKTFGVEKKSLNIYQLLSYFLIKIHTLCCEEFFKEYFVLIFMLIAALNDKGRIYLK